MTGAPFRDLFVELPAAVFEILQSIGNEAARRALPPQPVNPPPTSNLDRIDNAGRALARYMGWREVIRTERVQFECWTDILVRLDCGHIQRYRLDDLVLLRSIGSEWADCTLTTIENTERACQCVQRPTEIP